MSVVWRRCKGLDSYEIRRAGSSIRLYTNNVFHSQWNARQSGADSVWDLLSLPVFGIRQTAPRILVLGVGGGAVLRQVAALSPASVRVGVELDPVHVHIAKRWFGVSDRLCLANAVHWVQNYRGAPFDLVIDDLFGHTDGIATRAVEVDCEWMKKLSGLLSAQGIVVVNHASEQEWRSSSASEAGLSFRKRLALPLYDNVIGIYRRCPLELRRWRKSIESCDTIAAGHRRRLLRHL